MSQSIIVGQDCTIWEIVSIIKSTPTFSVLTEKLSDLIHELGFSTDFVRRLAQHIHLGTRTHCDALCEVLESWVAKKGDQATLDSLLGALKNNDLYDTAGALQRFFPNDSAQTKKLFCANPTILGLLEQSPETEERTCVVMSSPDVSITCKKISATAKLCRIHDVQKFLELESDLSLNENIVHVITTHNEDEFRAVLKCSSKVRKPFIVMSIRIFKTIRDFLKCNPKMNKMVRIEHDNVELNDLTSAYQHSIREDLENRLHIKLDEDRLGEILRGDVLLDYMNGGMPKLLKDNIPDDFPYYVNRIIRTRNVISEAIFEEATSHIFVFWKIPRPEVSDITKRTTELSSNFITQTKVDSNFIMLESLSHLPKICNRAQEPVHWLSMDNNRKLIWLKSFGSSSRIKFVQKFVASEPDQNLKGEEDFCKQLNVSSNSPICIVDSPGMGKSALLARIGRRLTKLNPSIAVVFFRMSDLVKKVARRRTQNITSVKEAILELACNNELGKIFLHHKLIKTNAQVRVELELMLDGLDEVDSADQATAYEILKLIQASFESVRIWVTSRPHLLQQLEVALNTLGYNICLFRKEDQIYSLTSYWYRMCKNVGDEATIKERLRKFARTCLEVLRSRISSKDSDVAGIPLQCLMIAEVFLDQAKLYAECTNTTPIQVNSIADLYQSLIDKKLRKYRATGEGRADLGKWEKLLWLMHVKLSFELLLPGSGLLRDVEVQATEVLKIGILESGSTLTSPHFIHRTFAEYMVARFIADQLTKEGGWSRKLSVLLIDKLLKCEPIHYDRIAHANYKYPQFFDPEYRFTLVVPHFLNSILVDLDQIPKPSLQLFRMEAFTSAFLRELVHASTECGTSNLLRLIVELNRDSDALDLGSVFNSDFLLVAASQSSLDVFKFALLQFEKTFIFDIATQRRVLERTLVKGEYCIAEFLLNERGLRAYLPDSTDKPLIVQFTPSLLHDCIVSSSKDSTHVIDKKIQIVHLLLRVDCHSQEEIEKVRENPLLAWKVHPRILLELVRLGANVLARDEAKNTVLHLCNGRDHLTNDDYNSLLKCVPLDNRKELLEVENKYKDTPLGTLLLKMEPLPSTLEMMHSSGANFNHSNVHEHSILAVAVRHKRSVQTIKKLIELGANVAWRKEVGRERKNLLHYAAQEGNAEVIKFLVTEQGLDVNEKSGMTPLDYAREKDKGGESDTCKILRELGGV